MGDKYWYLFAVFPKAPYFAPMGCSYEHTASIHTHSGLQEEFTNDIVVTTHGRWSEKLGDHRGLPDDATNDPSTSANSAGNYCSSSKSVAISGCAEEAPDKYYYVDF